MKECNAYKKQGYSVVPLIQHLFCLVFGNRSIFLDMQSEKAPEFKKDTVCRLKKSTHMDWKRFTALPSAKIITVFSPKLLERCITRKEEICALIVNFLAGVPADMKSFLNFGELMGTSTPEMGCEV